MTDLEISKALALAIGWKETDLIDKGTRLVCVTGFLQACHFDYRDWNVIGPIAERYKAFPRAALKNAWCSIIPLECPVYADTPQKAIALAVIAGAKK